MAEKIAPQGVYGIRLGFLGPKAVPKAVAPSPGAAPTGLFVPEFIGVLPLFPPTEQVQAYLLPSLQEFELIPVSPLLGDNKRYIKHRRDAKYLYPENVLPGPPSTVYILAGNDRFEWDIELGPGFTSLITTERYGTKYAISVENKPIPPHDGEFIPPVFYPPIVLKPVDESDSWFFEGPLPK